MQGPTISYAITVCTEAQEFSRLLNFLIPRIRPDVDEIVVLQDVSKKSKEVDRIFIDFADHIDTRITSKFAGNFADWKNELNKACTKDFIFQIDADEVPAEGFLENLPPILLANSSVDLFWVPRANTVEGLTQEDIDRWYWRVDERGWVNWPDYQGRIYRNAPNIKWEGRVHERIVGYLKFGKLPDSYFLHHDKTITKQREQNALYTNIAQHGK